MMFPRSLLIVTVASLLFGCKTENGSDRRHANENIVPQDESKDDRFLLLPLRDLSFKTLNNEVLGYRIPSRTGRPWNIDLPLYGYSVYTEPVVKSSAMKYGGLADSFGIYPWSPQTFEWDYTFHFGSQGGYSQIPADRFEAWSMLEENFIQRFNEAKKTDPNPYVLNGHYYYAHYSAKWGGSDLDLINNEIGENIQSTNAKVAFTRGAARQYGKSWGLQFSPWYGPSVLDYSSTPVWVNESTGIPYSGATHGHSLELAKRSYYFSYMAGANLATIETASVDWFNGESKDPDGNLFLSPMGKIGKQFYDVTHRFQDRGIPFTPIAIVIDELHGLGMDRSQIFQGLAKDSAGNKVKVGIDSTPADLMTRELFNSIWPKSFEEAAWDESKFFLSSSPYGEIFDVLTEDVELSVLAHYPIVILAGAVEIDSKFADMLTQYVAAGGSLVVNSAQIPASLSPLFLGLQLKGEQTVKISQATSVPSQKTLAISEDLVMAQVELNGAIPLIKGQTEKEGVQVNLATIQSFQAGRVIVTLPHFLKNRNLWGLLLATLQTEVLPFTVTGEVQTLFNKTNEGWVITLINNNGITKEPFTAALVDPAQLQNVTIAQRRGPTRIVKATEEIEDKDIPVDSVGRLAIAVPPGDVRILNVRSQ